MGQSRKIRTTIIERQLMIAELLLDGLNTHNNFKHCMNPIHARHVAKALSKVRSARDILRNDTNHRQLTLTTRSKQLNRGGVPWEYHAKSVLKCDCKNPCNYKGIWMEKGRMSQKPKPRKEKPLND